MKTSPIESSVAVPPRPAAPRDAGVSIVLALAAMMAWLVFSLIYREMDMVQPLELRRIDGLWGWMALALFQLLLTPEQESTPVRRVALATIGLGIVIFIFRQSLGAGEHDFRKWVPLTEAVVISIALLLTSIRALAHLQGRGVRSPDLWMFVALQWLLVWAAADLVLTWRNPAELPQQLRQKLVEMSLLGAGVHVALGLALAQLPVPRGAGPRGRASLAALCAYNLGMIALLFGFPWIGCPLMLIGGIFNLIASGFLLTGSERFVPLLVLAGAIFAISAVAMRPFDTGLFSGWRHAAGGGCLGLAAVIACVQCARVDVPEKYRLTVLFAGGSVLFLLGVITRMIVEVYVIADETVHPSAIYGSILEILGIVMVGLGAIRGRSIRKKLLHEKAK